jgi:hypothetical protein
MQQIREDFDHLQRFAQFELSFFGIPAALAVN